MPASLAAAGSGAVWANAGAIDSPQANTDSETTLALLVALRTVIIFEVPSWRANLKVEIR
jgi:hypothetical protein